MNAAVWLTPITRVPCSNAARTRNPLKLAAVPQTNETISAAGVPKFTILYGHVEKILLLNKFFFRLSMRVLVAKIWPDKIVGWCPDGNFLAIFACCILSELHTARFRPAFSIYTKATPCVEVW